MISQEQQARKKEMNSFIKSLTFLELCTVPKITPTYLSLFEVKQIKHIMLLNTQTLLQWQKYPQKEINPRRNQFAQSLKQCEKKILGQQLLHLLREICCFCLTKQLPLELIILQIEPNQDHLLIANTYKAILVSLMEYSEQARMRPDYVSALISLLDLVADLNDVSIDNCRALNLQKRGEQNGFIKKLQEVQQLLVMLVSENHNLYDNFVTYGLNLIKKYRFVILEQVYKDEKRQTVNQENRVNMIEVEEQELQAHQFQTTQILDFFKLCKTLQQKQAFLVNSYYNCLKNINHLNIQTFSSLYNTISISLSEILNIDLKDQGSKNEQSIQTISSRKSNHYCLLLGLKIMLALKQPQSDLRTTIIETQSVLKELLSFKVPKIELIYMLITTLSYVDIENDDLVDLTLVMVDFIVDFYAKKYPLKKEEYIFGVNLINYQEILKFWRKNRKSNKIQGKVLIDPIAQRLSEYQQNYIKILFEYLNPKLLDFLVKVYTTENNFFAFDSNEIKDEDKEKQKIMLVLRLFESRFTSQSNFLTDLLNGSKKQGIEDQRVKNKCNKSFEVMFDIWLQRSQQQQVPQGKAQFLIFTIIYQIYRVFKNDHIAYSRQYLVQKLIDKCKVKCYRAIISLINVQALDITIPTKKNLSQINLQNADAKIRIEIMDFLQLVLTFLHCFGFAINPIKNKMDFIHGLVVNSFVGEDKIDEILLLINEDIEIWKEMPEYQTILKYAQKYDTLELVYKYVIAKIYQQNKQRHQQSKRSFQKFCRQWCSKDEHYQWLSQQTTNRLKLLNFREYCCLYKNDQI